MYEQERTQLLKKIDLINHLEPPLYCCIIIEQQWF